MAPDPTVYPPGENYAMTVPRVRSLLFSFHRHESYSLHNANISLTATYDGLLQAFTERPVTHR